MISVSRTYEQNRCKSQCNLSTDGSTLFVGTSTPDARNSSSVASEIVRQIDIWVWHVMICYHTLWYVVKNLKHPPLRGVLPRSLLHLDHHQPKEVEAQRTGSDWRGWSISMFHLGSGFLHRTGLFHLWWSRFGLGNLLFNILEDWWMDVKA